MLMAVYENSLRPSKEAFLPTCVFLPEWNMNEDDLFSQCLTQSKTSRVFFVCRNEHMHVSKVNTLVGIYTYSN